MKLSKLKRERSLGLVITDQTAEAVWLQKEKSGCRILSAGRVALSENIIRRGQVRSAGALAAKIRQLMKQTGIGQRSAVVVLPDQPVLTQILEIPHNVPSNLHQYIRSEIRNSPVLAGRSPVYDFAGLGGERQGANRIFVGAVDAEQIVELTRAVQGAGIQIDSIEIDLFAVLRAQQGWMIPSHPNENIFWIHLHGDTMTTCVFLKGRPDFVQRKPMTERGVGRLDQVLSQVRTIRQFYEIEKEISLDSEWTFCFCTDQEPDDRAVWDQAIGDLLRCPVQVASPRMWSANPKLTKTSLSSAPSAAAVGAALKRFEPLNIISSPEFLSAETRRYYAFRRKLQLAAALSAVSVLMVFGLSMLLQFRNGTAQSARAAEAAEAGQPQALIEETARLEHHLQYTRQQVDLMERIGKGRHPHAWSAVFGHLQADLPSDMWFCSLEGFSDGSFVIRGKSRSLESLYSFSETLSRTEEMGAVEVSESQISPDQDSLFEYTLEGAISGSSFEKEAL